jgi:hypothetical protein
LDVPSWLRDIAAEEADEGITAEPFSFEGTSGMSQSPSPGGPPAWLTDSDDTTETVPDWLKNAVGEPEAAPPSTPNAPDVPLWLQDLGGGPAAEPAEAPAPIPAESEQAPVAPPAEAPEALPPWLQSADVAQPAAEDVPPWLHEPAPAAGAEEAPPWLQSADAAQPPTGDIPAWLADSQTQPPAAESMPAWLRDDQAPQPAAEDIPDWLRPAEAAEPTASAPLFETQDDTLPGVAPLNGAATPVEPAAPSVGADLPDWLRPADTPADTPDTGSGQDLPPWLRDEAGQPLPTAGVAGDTNLPAWLRGAPIEPPLATPAAPVAQAPSPGLDWLEEETQPGTQPASAAESEFFGSTELPAWLRPPEPEQPKEVNPADARSLDWLTRLGGPEEPEVVGAVTTVAPKLTPPAAPIRTGAQMEALALLERLAADPFPEVAPAIAPAQPNVLRRIGIERALYFALVIVLLIGLAGPLPDSLGLATPPVAPGASDLFTQIDKLSENDVVLVGYEWDARRSGELRPLEQAVLDHLIKRKIKMVLVSTDPQGTLLLFDLRDRLEAAQYQPFGQDYILLGYRPGAELALRSLAQDFQSALRSDFQGQDATRSVLANDLKTGQPRLTSISDFSMIIVLGDEPQDVQGWMEQIHRTAKQVPFAFLLPAETAPLVQPYLGQAGIYHLAGKQGALAYQSLRGDSGMPATQVALESGQQRLSLLLFIALFIVGAIVAGASTAARRGKRP